MATESLNNLKQSFLRIGLCDVSEPFIEPAKDITHAQLKSFMIPIFQISDYNHQEIPLTNSNSSHQNKKHTLQVVSGSPSCKKVKKNEEAPVKIDKEDSTKSTAVGNSKNFSRIVSTEMKKISPKLSPSSPQGSPVRAGSPVNITTVVATSTAHPSLPCSESLKKNKRKEMDRPLIQTFESVKKPYASKSSDKLSSCVPSQDKICLRVCGLSKGKYDPKFEPYSFPVTSTIEDLQSVIEKSRCNENEKIAVVVRTVWNNDMMVPKKIEPSTLLLNDSHNTTWELHLQAHQIVLNRIA